MRVIAWVTGCSFGQEGGASRRRASPDCACASLKPLVREDLPACLLLRRWRWRRRGRRGVLWRSRLRRWLVRCGRRWLSEWRIGSLGGFVGNGFVGWRRSLWLARGSLLARVARGGAILEDACGEGVGEKEVKVWRVCCGLCRVPPAVGLDPPGDCLVGTWSVAAHHLAERAQCRG
eukprot:5793167-Prymnesium_polylepis.1